MTKEQLMQFIEVDSEEDKDDCEFYLDVKGVEIHCAIMDYLQFDFLEGSKIKWSIISQKLKEDKNLRYKLTSQLQRGQFCLELDTLIVVEVDVLTSASIPEYPVIVKTL